MNEMNIITNMQSPQEKGTEIAISIENEIEQNLLYKFLIGNDGTWETIKDFQSDSCVNWHPKDDGKYIIMVQAKNEGSKKPFDFMSKIDYIIGKCEENLIKSIYLDKDEVKVGEKINLNVEGISPAIMYRYWIKENSRWTLLTDYSAQNNLSYTPKQRGEMEFLVECKNIQSKNLFDDFKSIRFEVLPISSLEITNFRCISTELLVDSELIFEVEANFDESRVILYKFVKINEYGEAICIQDYSTKRLVSFSENKKGDYKLLCLAKDMYSPKEFDDRAIIHYKIAPYNPIKLLSFTSDLSSPQVIDTAITLKTVASGGKELLYRFVIDGNESQTTKYNNVNSYLWKPTKCGEYIIEVYIKDKSFDGDYELKEKMNFTIEEDFVEKVAIAEILFDKKRQLLVKEPINVKVIATGGIELKYSFIVKKNDRIVDKIEYGDNNWVDFSPEEVGQYELEIMVKDKRSKREYDVHSVAYIDCYEYIPAKIEYVLTSSKEYYLVGDSIVLEAVIENTENSLIKYNIKINGHEVERSDFISEKKFRFIPRCAGRYVVDIMGKNISSTVEYDSKKSLIFNVLEAPPITNCKITIDKEELKCNESINFTVNSQGGKDTIYEFYLMEKGDWRLIQKYSKKSYYTFIPFKKGFYKLLALTKSSHKKIAYEDYDILEIKVNS